MTKSLEDQKRSETISRGASSVVLDDLPCHGCDYNLRHMRTDGRCPECGAPVKVSVAGDALQFANLEWVRRIDLGAHISHIAVPSCFVLGGLFGAIATISSTGIGTIGGSFVWVVIVVAEAVGFWLFSSPNPAMYDTREAWNSPRRLIRIGLVGTFLAIVASFIPTAWPLGQKFLWLHLVGGPLGFLGFLGQQGLCGYCEQISMKMGDVAGVYKSQQYGHGYRRVWTVTATGTVIALLTQPQYGALLYVPGLIGMMYYGLLGVLMPWMISTEIAKHRAMAETVWAEALKGTKQHDDYKNFVAPDGLRLSG